MNVTNLPLRQKILIGLTIVIGVIIIICSSFNLLNYHSINILIFTYSIGIPFYLISEDAIIDLNDNRIFKIWLFIGIVMFAFSLGTYNIPVFKVQRSDEFDPTSGISKYFGEYSTSSLKALIIFLVIYWLLNKLLNRYDLYLINTFMKKKWYHEAAHREIMFFDVLINLVLYLVILAAGILGG